MVDILTEQDSKFVGEVIKTGNKTRSAQKAYNIKSYQYAGVKAHRQIKKDKIIKSIAEALPNDFLQEKHKQLLNAVNLEKLYFDERDDDATIEGVVAQMEGYKLLHIVALEDSNGKVHTKYAYVKAPDNTTQDKALDKAYKIKGTYAPEKSINLNVEVETSKEELKAAAILNEIYRRAGVTDDGAVPGDVGTEAQDKE